MARRLSSDEYAELGRKYYKLNQYDRTISILTEGIDSLPTMILYDYRAAAYDKLTDYDSAVKDGREMIKLDKTEVKGYLRTARVLEKLNRANTALGIYKYGMKNVPVNDKNFKLLQQLHDRLTRKLSPATAKDPFTLFPVELAEMILQYLSFRQMVNCMRVCKGWRDYVAKLPKLWQHLDLSEARRPVRRSFVAQAIKRSQNRCTHVTIHRFEHIDILKNIAIACKDLAVIEIISLPHAASETLMVVARQAANLKSFIIHPEITLLNATEILKNRPSLESITYGAVRDHRRHAAIWSGSTSQLKSLDMRFAHPLNAEYVNMKALYEKAPNMQSLTLCGIISAQTVGRSLGYEPPPLTSLTLKRVAFSFFPIVPPSLQKLTIEYNGMFILTDVAMTRLDCLPKLTHIRLWGFQLTDQYSLSNLLDTAVDESESNLISPSDLTPLQSFSFRSIFTHREHARGSFAGNVFSNSARILTPVLQNLDVAEQPISDSDVESLIGLGLKLQSIDLSSTRITGAGIKTLVDKMPSLRRINADYCDKITGRDALEYAERRGVNVSCKLGEHMGGRKVRYQ